MFNLLKTIEKCLIYVENDTTVLLVPKWELLSPAGTWLLASYKGPLKTQWHTWVYKWPLLDTGTPLLVQHENLKLHHFTSSKIKRGAHEKLGPLEKPWKYIDNTNTSVFDWEHVWDIVSMCRDTWLLAPYKGPLKTQWHTWVTGIGLLVKVRNVNDKALACHQNNT